MEMDKNVLTDIEEHLLSLRSKFNSIFPAEKIAPSWVQNPFPVKVNKVEEKLQEEILDLTASHALAARIYVISVERVQPCKNMNLEVHCTLNLFELENKLKIHKNYNLKIHGNYNLKIH